MKTTTAAEAPSIPELFSRLAARLPAEGPILALGALAADHVPRRTGVERRALAGAMAPRKVGSASWDAIVVALDPEMLDWPSCFAALRESLTQNGRLFVILAFEGKGAGTAATSEAVAALCETGFCVQREEAIAPASTSGEAGDEAGEEAAEEIDDDEPSREVVVTTFLIEARPDDHVVRAYREGDETAILSLFEASFSPPRGHDHWRWKYRDNPSGTLAISCAFAANGDLVAHYAGYPVRFRRSERRTGETILCHQVGDTMTDRRYRHVGRGRTSLLARTVRHFYATRCDGRVAFNYGFNTGNIQRFSELFVGARKVWDIELWQCRTADLRLAKRRRFRPYRASRVERLDSAFDDLFERLAPLHGLLVERRRAYLDWRYLRCPDRDYHLIRVDQGSHLVGWGVFRADGDRLLWGDALFDPEHPDAVSALLREASAIAALMPASGAAPEAAASPPPSEQNQRRIEGWFSRHPAWWSEWLAQLGFVSVAEPQALGMVFVPFLECPDDELATGYYLTMGDSDLF